MSHIDTLKVYNEYIAAGYTPAQAKVQTDILANSFATSFREYVKELREDFVSNKTQLLMNSFIILALSGIFTELWRIHDDVKIHDCRISKLEDRVK